MAVNDKTTVISMPPEMHTRLKIVAAKMGSTMNSIMVNGVEAYLEHLEKSARIREEQEAARETPTDQENVA